jgi:hypothetical protein
MDRPEPGSVKPRDLAALAEHPEGSLAEVPFGAVLLAHALEHRTLALEIQRRQIRKTILLEDGVPVECRSNLLRETFGEFLVGEGRITAFQCRESLAEAATRGILIGAVLMEKGLIDPLDLRGALKRNFGHKLLECFTWIDGEYRLFPELTETQMTSPVNVPRLVFNGLTRFTPPEKMYAWVGPLMRRPLSMHPDPPIQLAHLRLSAQQRQIVAHLRKTRYARDLLRQCGLPRDEVLRTLAALAVMGVVVIRKLAVDRNPLKTEIAADLAEAMDSEPERRKRPEPEVSVAVVLSAPDAHRLRIQIAAEHVEQRGKNAFELLGIDVGASEGEARRRYVELMERYAPARFEAPALQSVQHMADDLLRAAVNAYEIVSSLQQRPVEPRPQREQEASLAESECATSSERQSRETAPAAEEILLDDVASTGREAAAAAESSDEAESAYARFRASPDAAERALQELASLDSAGARLYAAEICHSLGEFATARDNFMRGCALWGETSERASGAPSEDPGATS